MEKKEKFLEVVNEKEMLEELCILNYNNLSIKLLENGYDGLCFSGVDYIDIDFIKEDIIKKLKNAYQYGRVKVKINNVIEDNSQNGFDEDVEFNNFIFEYGFNFSEEKGQYFSKKIIFKDCEFKKNVKFKNCSFEKSLIFENCKFRGKLEIKDCNIIKNKKLKGDIELYDIKDLKNLTIRGSNFNSIELKHVFMEKEEGTFLFYGLELNNFSYTGSSKLPETISLTDTKIKGLLKFSFINLGKTIFNGVKIKKLYLKNATLNDCIFNGVDFKSYELDKGKLSNKQLKDNYRQLKHVMDKNGNYTEANKFFEKEMEYYLKSLDIKKMGFFGTFKELFDSNFLGNNTKKIGEKIVLLFGWNVNEFGNNWIKPLEGIIILALIATLSDISSSFFGIKYGNYLGDLFFVIFVIIGFIILVYTKAGKIVDSKLSKVNNLKSIVFLFVIILLGFLIPNYDPIKVFSNFLNPLFLKENGVIYNGIEIFGLVLYKTIYGILLWHLLIALKRTTKR